MPDEELLAAYARATYRVDLPSGAVFLQVSAPAPEIDRRLAAKGLSGFAFLSAANPGSVVLSDEENRRRHLQLGERLHALGLSGIAGESYETASGGWREASLLVCGIEREAAIALAREFGQMALLYGRIGGPVELVPAAGARSALGT